MEAMTSDEMPDDVLVVVVGPDAVAAVAVRGASRVIFAAAVAAAVTG